MLLVTTDWRSLWQRLTLHWRICYRSLTGAGTATRICLEGTTFTLTTLQTFASWGEQGTSVCLDIQAEQSFHLFGVLALSKDLDPEQP